MKIFISGGCKNGKSWCAQHLAQAQSLARAQHLAHVHRPADALHPANGQQAAPLYYVATMKPADAEDDERIVRHQAERDGWGFTTVEQPDDIGQLLSKCDHDGSLLFDSLTALLANEMFLPDGAVNKQAAEKITGGLLPVIERFRDIVIVSDFLYSDAESFDSLTELYRKSLASLDRTAARHCEVVLEVVSTNIIVHKGKETFENGRFVIPELS